MAYWPGPAPKGQEYARQELEKLAADIRSPKLLQLTVSTVEPDKPRDGMIALADGTAWNPGAGAGFYGRYGSAWVKLG